MQQELTQGIKISDRYTLLEYKGSGSFGEVWLAHDDVIDEQVALKIYVSLDPRGIEEFKTEYKTTINISHSCLLTPNYFDVWEHRPFLVMKYCSNGSAASKIDNITEQELWQFIHDVAAGLAYLHTQPDPIIHQDIKPDNILIDDSGRYLLTDFGISKKLRSTIRKQSGRSTGAGAVSYMGPERFEADSTPIKASDIWSLGVSIYELAMGELPFSGMGGVMLKNGAELPALVGEQWSNDLNKTMQLCLAKAPWDRPTAEQLEKYADAKLRGEQPTLLGNVQASAEASYDKAKTQIVSNVKTNIQDTNSNSAKTTTTNTYPRGKRIEKTGTSIILIGVMIYIGVIIYIGYRVFSPSPTIDIPHSNNALLLSDTVPAVMEGLTPIREVADTTTSLTPIANNKNKVVDRKQPNKETSQTKKTTPVKAPLPKKETATAKEEVTVVQEQKKTAQQQTRSRNKKTEQETQFDKAYRLWQSKDSQDKVKANEMFIELADSGFVKAYSYAALAFSKKKDNDSFEKYGNLALDNDDNWIGKQLGDYYVKKAEYQKAVRSYEKALNSNWKADVALSLGKMYENGQGVSRDIEKAKEMYKISINAERGNIEYCEAYQKYKALGGESIYMRQAFYDAEGHYDKSLSPQQLFNKGEEFLDGYVTKKDPYKGYAYIKAAADLGNPEAMAKLSDMYTNSLYGLNDKAASQKYAALAIAKYKELANEGNGDACCELGNCYKRGYLTQKDTNLSRHYYLKGASLNHWHCLRYCGEIYEEEGDFAKAADYYQKATDKKEMMAAYALANMYLDGRGVPEDRTKAIELYKACATAHWACKSDAIRKLKSLGVDTSGYSNW